MKTGLQPVSIGWLKLAPVAGLAAGMLLLSSAETVNAADAAAPAESAKPAESAEPAADTKAAEPAASEEEEAAAELTPEQMFEGGEKTYANWVEISAGGLIMDGNRASGEQRQQYNHGAFGGIEDLHYQHDVGKDTTLTLDGHSIFGPDDYALSLGVKKEKLGYARFSFENFKTYYNTSGGWFPPNNLFFSAKDDAWDLDRGVVGVELGLTLADIPKFIFKYTHRYRDGEKDSTIWGPAQTAYGLRGLVPAWYDIDETSDTFELDGSYQFKATQFGVGVRYENGDIDNRYKAVFRPQEAVRRNLTDTQGTSYDMVSVHAWTETWIKNNLSFSTGFMFANLDDSFSGSRIFGDDFDVNYTPNTLNTYGYYDLNGGAHKQEYIGNINLMAVPLNHFTIVPSIRIQKEDWDADSAGIGTLGNYFAEPFQAKSDRDFLEVRERVDLRYNGITNWVFYAGPEWTEGSGSLRAQGGFSRVNDIGVAPVNTATDDSRFYQKYFAGVRWYPADIVTVDAGGYYKLNSYDWERNVDSTPNEPASPDRYPGFLTMQDFQTYDANFRLTLRPLKRITLVSRYEYQNSTISTTPDPDSGLAEVDSSDMTSHIFAQNVSWTPWSRLSLQAGFNYVVSKTETPTSDYTQAVLDAKNNYWTLNFNAGFVVDNKTDLNLGYFYYESDDYGGDYVQTLPVGAGAKEHGVTAAIVRRLTENLRLNLRYGYSHFEDIAYGGNNSYEAHLIYSSLQYRF